MKSGLFSRLDRYSFRNVRCSENFLTELIAYLLGDYDLKLRDRLLKKILLKGHKHQERMLEHYRNAAVHTQYLLCKGAWLDIALLAGTSRLAIENKLTARETVSTDAQRHETGQIKKYLRDLKLDNDYLVHISPMDYPRPEQKESSRFHACHWEEIYAEIMAYNSCKKDPLLNQVLLYMEEIGMKNADGFDNKDVKNGQRAFLFIKKSNSLLNLLKEDVKVVLERQFRSKCKPSQIKYQWDEWGSASIEYSSTAWKPKITLSVFIADNRRTCVTIGPGKWGATIVAKIRRHQAVEQQRKKLISKFAWTADHGENNWWEVYKTMNIPVRTTLASAKNELMINIRHAIEELSSSRLMKSLNACISKAQRKAR